MKRFLFLLAPVLFLGILHAQTPDWLPPAQLVQSGTADVPAPNGYFDNRAIEVQTLTVAYQSDGGISGFTIAAQYATGTNTPGSFSTLTPVASSSSFGTAQYGVATFNLLSATPGSSIPAPWIRVDVSGGTGVGGIRIEMYGYRTGPGAGGGGAGGVCPNPCPVTQSTSPWVDDITQWANVALGAPSAYGTSPGAVNVPGVNAAITQNVAPPGLGTFNAGVAAVTGTAGNLGTNTSKNVCIHALVGNLINVYAGPSGVTTATGMEIPPGQNFCWDVANTNLIYVIASTTGASVSWTLTN